MTVHMSVWYEKVCVHVRVVQSGTTHLLYFSVAARLRDIDGLDVSRLSPSLQRVQLVKSQLPDAAFPPDTNTLVMHVDNVISAHSQQLSSVRYYAALPTRGRTVHCGRSVRSSFRLSVYHIPACKLKKQEHRMFKSGAMFTLDKCNSPCHLHLKKVKLFTTPN